MFLDGGVRKDRAHAAVPVAMPGAQRLGRRRYISFSRLTLARGRGPRLGGPKVVAFGIRAVRSAQRLLTHTPALPTSPTAPPPSILSSSPPGTASSSFTSSWKAAMGMERLDWSHRDGPQSEALRTAIGLCSGFSQCSHLSHDGTRPAHEKQALNARRNPI